MKTFPEQARGFTGVRLLQALSCILVLTVLVPSGAATLINRSRINRAQDEIARLVNILRDTELMERARRQDRETLLGGPGMTPDVPAVSRWAQSEVANLNEHISQELQPDPWGKRYLVYVASQRTEASVSTVETARWVLSAGPNGVIESPDAALAVSVVLGGDDIGAQIE